MVCMHLCDAYLTDNVHKNVSNHSNFTTNPTFKVRTSASVQLRTWIKCGLRIILLLTLQTDMAMDKNLTLAQPYLPTVLSAGLQSVFYQTPPVNDYSPCISSLSVSACPRMSVLLKLEVLWQPQYHCAFQFRYVCTDSICLILAVKALSIKACVTT